MLMKEPAGASSNLRFAETAFGSRRSRSQSLGRCPRKLSEFRLPGDIRGFVMTTGHSFGIRGAKLDRLTYSRRSKELDLRAFARRFGLSLAEPWYGIAGLARRAAQTLKSRITNNGLRP